MGGAGRISGAAKGICSALGCAADLFAVILRDGQDFPCRPCLEGRVDDEGPRVLKFWVLPAFQHVGDSHLEDRRVGDGVVRIDA